MDKIAGYNVADLLRLTQTPEMYKGVLGDLEELDFIEWNLLGDQENQGGALNENTKPEHALTELVTNAFDAHIEKVQMEERRRLKDKYDADDLPNKRTMIEELGYRDRFELVEEEFGMAPKYENGGPDEKHIEPRVILLGPEHDEQTTVDVLDAGIGLHTENIEDTILALHGSNKLYKDYQMGKFGQGRASALGISEGSLILTRSAIEDDGIAVGFMKKIPQGTEVDGGILQNDQWKYAKDKRTGEVPTMSFSSIEEWPLTDKVKEQYERILRNNGTVIRHVGFNLPSKGSWSRSTLYHMFERSLPIATLPVRVSDLRSPFGEEPDPSSGGSAAKGIIRKLSTEDNQDDIIYDSDWRGVGHQNNECDEDGTYMIRVVVQDELSDEWTRRGNHGGIILNGQVHGTLNPRTILQDTFPLLADQTLMFCQLDNLPQGVINDIISSNRERIKDRYQNRIEEMIEEQIKGEEQLKRLHEKKRKESQRETSSSTEDVIKELNENFTEGPKKITEGDGPGGGSSTGNNPYAHQEKIWPVQNPEEWEVTVQSPDRKEVHPEDKQCNVNVRTNAPWKEFMDDSHDHRFAPEVLKPVPSEGDTKHMWKWCPPCEETGRDYAPTTFVFRPKDDASIVGKEGELRFRLKWKGKVVAEDSIQLVGTHKPGSGCGTSGGYKINDISYYSEEEEEWAAHFGEDPENRLLEVFVVNEDELDIKVSKEHPMLRSVEKEIESRDGRHNTATREKYRKYFYDRELTRYIGKAVLGFVGRQGAESIQDAIGEEEERRLIDAAVESSIAWDVKTFPARMSEIEDHELEGILEE